MFRKEEKLTIGLSSLATLVILSQCSFLGDRISIICFSIYPIFIMGIFHLSKAYISKEKCQSAVINCLEESEFNVIDHIEQLRMYFKNTTDVVEYLTHVDSRLLVYIFNKSIKDTRSYDFFLGAMESLAAFKKYYGNYYLDIDILSLPYEEKIATMLSVAYLVGLEMEVEKDNIYITVQQIDEGVKINVTSKCHKNSVKSVYINRLFNLFSSSEFLLKDY